MQMTVDELKVILDNHMKWIKGQTGGVKADLSGADLSGVDLFKADLSGADLSGAKLSGADLSGADLSGADLSGADLSGAKLSGVDLSGADLSGAELSGADLSGAKLSGVDLFKADLSGADLSGAKLSGVDLSGVDLSGALNTATAFAMTSITPDGDLIGWKKCYKDVDKSGTCIVKLKIPMNAKRSNSSGRKCRAEWAQVLEVIGSDKGYSSRSSSFVYISGEIVRSDSWDDNRWNECSSGIHFFITREEAEAYQF